MDAPQAAEQIKVIRELMERPVRCTTHSGASAVWAGLVSLAGVAADAAISARFAPYEATAINMFVWLAVFAAAFAGAVALTRRRARKEGRTFWTTARNRALRAIVPPFLAGGGLTAAIVYRWVAGVGPNQWGLIPGIWMTFYGVALWQIGEFSIRATRILAGAFILSGIVAAAVFQYTIPGLTEGTAPYWTLGITFGGYHLAYGAIVWIRHGG